MTVLIAGCGDLGTEIGLRFVATGRRVYGARRSPQRLPTAIAGLGVDLSRELPEVPTDTEIVVMATSADRRSEQAYRSAYLDALRNLLDGLCAHDVRPRRFVLVSSTSVYGLPDGWVDEETPPDPASSTGAVLLEAEQLLHQSIPHAVSLRLAGIYGPGRTRLVDQVRTGDLAPEAADRYTNRIHRDDAAAAVVHLATMRDAPEPVYIGVDTDPAPRSSVVAFLADRLDVPTPMPETDTSPAGKRCHNDRLERTGFRYRYPSYREGYTDVLAGKGVRHL